MASPIHGPLHGLGYELHVVGARLRNTPTRKEYFMSDRYTNAALESAEKG